MYRMLERKLQNQQYLLDTGSAGSSGGVDLLAILVEPVAGRGSTVATTLTRSDTV